MGIFKRKQKIRFSPRLAAAAGGNTYVTGYLKDRLYIFIPLAIVVVIVSVKVARSDSGIKSESQAAGTENGQVLGETDSDIVNYAVKPGDTLMSLGDKYRVYWMTIVEENELKAPYTLQPGQILRIPLPRN